MEPLISRAQFWKLLSHGWGAPMTNPTRPDLRALIDRLRTRALIEAPEGGYDWETSSADITWGELRYISALLSEAADTLAALSAPAPAALGTEEPPMQRTAKQYEAERAEALMVLRSTCERFGDNNWDESLHVADIIDKHLRRHLEAHVGAEEPPADYESLLADVAEIKSACGFMWMRMAVVKDAQDAYDVAKREFENHEAAFKRLEAALPKMWAALAPPSTPASTREHDALEWLVNLGYGVGKAGNEPEPGEIETALEYGRDALTLSASRVPKEPAK